MSVRLRRVDLFLTRAFASAATRRNLRYGTISSLALISAHPGVSQGELAEAHNLDKSALVLIVNGLEARLGKTHDCQSR